MRRLASALLALLLALPLATLAAGPAPPASGPGQALDVGLPSGLVGMARIYRDGFGVPHIFADDGYTLFYANGYAQAQDRMFAMDVLRHVGEGNAALVLGPGLLGSDVAARRELYTTQERLDRYLALPADGQRLLSAYVDGVNRALAEMVATATLPAEFLALNHAPEPWTVLDTVAVADFLLERFGTGGGDELGNAHFLAQLQGALGAAEGEKAFGDAVLGVSGNSYPTIPEAEGAFQGPVSLPKALGALPPEQAAALASAEASEPFGIPQGVPPLDERTSALPGFDPQRIKWGSNALLVSPALSRSGQALMGGGPQTGYFNPQILYEVGLHGAGWDVVGVGVMGAPGVVLGRTPTFAWTVTSGVSDETDIVALPAAGDRAYFWDGALVYLDCRTEAHVAVTPPALGVAPPQVFTQEVCLSLLGPVEAWTVDADGDPTMFFAAHKAHRGLELAGAIQWLDLDRAQDLQDFRASFEGFPFTFNFNYAGPEGACYHHVGMQPVRNPALDPRFPTPAGQAWLWQGMLTGAQMPRACNPAQGYFANWNNLPQRGWPSGDNRETWGSVHRVQGLDRAAQLAIQGSPDGKLDLAQVKDILRYAATHDPLAAPMVAQWLPFAPPAAQAALQAWQDHGFAWADGDHDGVYDDLGHAYYDAVRIDLQARVLGDEEGPFLRAWNPDPRTAGDPHAADHGAHDNKDTVLLDALSGAAQHAWCDDITTDAAETCAQQVQASFARVGDPAPTAVHRSRFTAIGAGPAYEMDMTDRATYYHFHVGTDTSQSASAIPPGQSGYLSVPDLLDIVLNHGQGPVHMRDQLPLYVGFQFKPVPVTEAQAAALSGAPTTLVVPIVPAV
jgi:penicillin amidase